MVDRKELEKTGRLLTYCVLVPVHRVSLVAQTVKGLPANVRDPGLIPGFRKIKWKRKRLPTLVFLPGEFHGQRSLAG